MGTRRLLSDGRPHPVCSVREVPAITSVNEAGSVLAGADEGAEELFSCGM
jgi:hypothetical protein